MNYRQYLYTDSIVFSNSTSWHYMTITTTMIKTDQCHLLSTISMINSNSLQANWKSKYFQNQHYVFEHAARKQRLHCCNVQRHISKGSQTCFINGLWSRKLNLMKVLFDLISILMAQTEYNFALMTCVHLKSNLKNIFSYKCAIYFFKIQIRRS